MKFGKGFENYTKAEQERIALGRKVSSEGMVLLKNNGALPLKAGAKVALFGVGQIGFLHGGSGSAPQDIEDAVSYGVVKMNIDTDTQWATWDGVLQYYKAKQDYLQGQLGNPEGPDAPNKKYYDPRAWLRKGQESEIARLQIAFENLHSANTL